MSFLGRKPILQSLKLRDPPTHLHIFMRHCLHSKISRHKKRLPDFSHEACYRNFIDTVDTQRTTVTHFFDGTEEEFQLHFLSKELNCSFIRTEGKSEASSFLQMLDYVLALELAPQEVLYFVEDDYLHRPRWVDVLFEAFSLYGVDYVTLYDHRDKYISPMYKGLKVQIAHTKSCHWRTIPSTTHTFATRYETLRQDVFTHRRFSKNREISDDHSKFCALQRKGRILISPMPAWATHVDLEFLSPCIDWR